jgi:Bacterial Fe(2+) trafficking.
LLKNFKKIYQAWTVPPMPGPKGRELMETVFQEAWESWKFTSNDSYLMKNT